MPIVILEGIGYFILWPVLRKRAILRVPRQFFLADFAALLVYLQLVLVLIFYYRSLLEHSMGIIGPLSILAVAAAALWGAAVGMLNQLGILTTWRRMAFLLILLPGVSSIMVGVPLAFVFAARGKSLEDHLAPSPLRFILALAVLTLAAIALRFLSAWLVKDCQVMSRPGSTPRNE